MTNATMTRQQELEARRIKANASFEAQAQEAEREAEEHEAAGRKKEAQFARAVAVSMRGWIDAEPVAILDESGWRHDNIARLAR